MKTSQQTDNSIFGEDITKLSKSPYLTSPLGRGQTGLISKSWLYSIVEADFPNLKSEGVCNGLCLDYARHIVSHRNTNTKSDYIAKLKRKFTIFGKNSKTFAKRINMYQKDLQSSEQDRVTIQNSSTIFGNHQFIESLPNEFSASSIIGLSFKGEKGGHIIAIQAIKNDQSDIIGYKIFDPNVGELDCSKSEVAADNIQHFNEVIQDIYEMYSAVETISCSVTDLEKKVEKYELVKPQDRSKYKSEYKYLDHNPNSQTVENKRLSSAADSGEIEVVRSFLADKRTEVNKPNENGATPLYIAAQNGYTEIVELLLADKRIEVNRPHNNGATALFIAAQNGHTEIVELLLADKRTEVNKRRDDSYTALYIAAQMGHTEIVSLFLADKRTEVNKECEGDTAFYIASQNGYQEIVRMFVTDKRTDIDRTCDGVTPLSAATQNGHKGVIKIIEMALLKEKILKTLKTSQVTSSLNTKVANLSKDEQVELVNQIKFNIKELAAQNKGWSIHKIISTFPEGKRMEYFFDSARKAVLECAKRGDDQKVELIFSAFPKQQDRDIILASSVLTPFYPLAKPSLIKRSINRIHEALNNTPKKTIASGRSK